MAADNLGYRTAVGPHWVHHPNGKGPYPLDCPQCAMITRVKPRHPLWGLEPPWLPTAKLEEL